MRHAEAVGGRPPSPTRQRGRLRRNRSRPPRCGAPRAGVPATYDLAVEPGRFVYHGAPANVVGNRLVSLYALETIDPGAFRREISKYAGRESAPEFVIPGLGCRFNDTIHCAPIHPWYIFEARIAEGLVLTGPMSDRTYYRIPVSSLNGNRVVWYQARTIWLNAAPGEVGDVPSNPPADEFEAFDAARYSELTAIPPAYRPRLRESIATGRRPLTFVHIPHVLVAGSIDLADATIVDPFAPPKWEQR
jgi:hypothetical protein